MFAKIDNLQINYEAYGHGPKLLLLHGWAVNLHTFDKVNLELSQRFQVVTVDLPGFGLSQAPPTTYGVFDYANFVEKFLEFLDIRETSILGHSMGGAIALAYCSRFHRATKLVLADSSGVQKKKLWTQVKVAFFRTLKLITLPSYRENLKKIFGSSDYKNAGPMRQILVKIVNEDLTFILPSIKVPTLLIWGENDRTTTLKEGKIMNREIKDSRLAILSNCDHFPHLEYPEKFVQLVTDFLLGKG